MKAGLPLIKWILIIVFAGQGALPGVVVCVEPAGQVKVESIVDNCCYENRNPSSRTATGAFAPQSEPESRDSCGPCTDTPLSLVPVTKPSRGGDVSVGVTSITAQLFAPAATTREISSEMPYVAAHAALIPVKTTALLI